VKIESSASVLCTRKFKSSINSFVNYKYRVLNITPQALAMIPKHKPSNLLKIGATLLQSQFVTKMKATDIPPQLKIKSYKVNPQKNSAENQHFEATK
jgi:hypothetical protein